MTLHLVYNKKSGRGEADELLKLATELCRTHQTTLISHPIDNPKLILQICKTAVEAAVKDGGVVAAAGGDGTVRCVAHMARGTEVKVAVIPRGTFNLFARTHNIPEETTAALELAIMGQTKSVRLAEINGETFILNASFGLYAKAIRERAARTKRFGRRRIVAVLSTVKSMLEGHSTMDVELTMDAKPQHLKTQMVFIGNNALQLQNLKLDVAKCMKNDRLAVVTLKQTSTFEMVSLLFHGLMKKLENVQSLDSFCADSLVIKPKTRHLEVALDGELFRLTTPLKIQSQPNALLLVKP